MASNMKQKPDVLVIDDDTQVSQLIMMIAEGLGYTTSSIQDFEEIESTLDSITPRIIFLDLRFENHDGLEILEILATQESKARIVLISGVDQGILASACQAGKQSKLKIAGYIHKPFDIDLLEKCLKEELDDRSRFTSPRLQEALGAGECIIEYLPIFDLNARGSQSPLCGLELSPYWRRESDQSLSRWQLGNKLKLHNLVDEFTTLLLDKTFQSYKEWNANKRLLQFSISIDDASLFDPEWPSYLKSEIQRFGISPELVTISFSYADVTGRVKDIVATLTRLRIGGFKIAIETEGRDSNELAELLHLPINELRLSTEVVSKLGSEMESEFIATTLICIAQRQGLITTALGVDSMPTLKFLQEAGCTNAMGPLFGKSLSLKQLMELEEHGALPALQPDAEKGKLYVI